MKTSSQVRPLKLLLLLTCVIAVSAGFTSCSSDSGSTNTPNIDPGPEQPGNQNPSYSGKPPATSDVQAFKLNVWDNLAADNRCGSCHQQGGSGEGYFVRDDDINLAYNAAVNIVDLGNPAASRMVTKVASGHNCWTSDPNACADIITGWITDWATESGSVINQITLTAPAFKEVQDSRSFPEDSAAFEELIHEPILEPFCGRCHSPTAATPQMPFFASGNIAEAYSLAKPRIDLGDLERANNNQRTRSRFIVRLRDEGHNCWSDCASDAAMMQAAILEFAEGTELTEINPALLTSGAVNLVADGIVASTGGRVEADVIALYTFKPPTSADVGEPIQEVFDVSGEGNAANLRAYGSDVRWVGGWGARINSGRLQGSASKLYDSITLTGEYSIEAWVVPGNVVQDNSARIVTYAGGSLTGNNFAMAQSAYNYDFLHRSSSTDLQGMPAYSTPDADEVLQATLQHVVMTYDPINGRRIFVNGENVVAQMDPQAGGNFASWDNSFALTLGQNAGGGDQWQGTLRLLAIHNRALAPEDIATNFAVGVGEKFFLLFDLSRAGLVDMPQAYIAFEVEQFDSNGYLFKNPFFISLDPEAVPTAPITIRGMRIGMNGEEVSGGQAYARLQTTIDSTSYQSSGQLLSSFGTIIPVGNGPELDEFFLSFDQIGEQQYERPVPTLTSELLPSLSAEPQSRIAVRHFEEINAALSALTGVPSSNAAVADTFELVRTQLPQGEAIDGFLPAHQMGITQLSVRYCNELARDASLRGTYFADFAGGNWSASSDTVFADSNNRAAIIDPILSRLASDEAADLGTQPLPGPLRDELNDLIDRMAGPAADPLSSTVEVVTGVCAAAMGSSLMMVQ